ncbi:melanocortin-2 receptor accessory protein [Cricetulus griseus]|nr:melanocortin-2 receptor accessory protein [Cricetulus griseus]
MANRTNTSVPYTSYEYYLDYLDLIPVDEKKLKAHKHSILIAFWVSLVTFVVLLFLILLYMSWSGSPQMREKGGWTGNKTVAAPEASEETPSGLPPPPTPPRLLCF